MKKISILLFAVLMQVVGISSAQEISLEEYLLSFDYEARKEMKINSDELVELLKENKAQLVDIRFEEEFQAWNMPFAIGIPLPDLPNNLHKLDRDKIIVTACPVRDRAIIAMTYLKTQGYSVKYLTDGLLGLAGVLRGDNAKEFIDAQH